LEKQKKVREAELLLEQQEQQQKEKLALQEQQQKEQNLEQGQNLEVSKVESKPEIKPVVEPPKEIKKEPVKKETPKKNQEANVKKELLDWVQNMSNSESGEVKNFTDAFVFFSFDQIDFKMELFFVELFTIYKKNLQKNFKK
jgi:hypothetical protein